MLPPEIDGEVRRLQACCEFAAEWQVTAAGFWTNLQMFLGAAAAGLAAVASGSAFSDQNVFAGSLAAAAALAAAVLASLRPGERSEEHKKAADEYHALVIDLRMFREFGVTPAEVDGQQLEVLAFFEQRAAAMTRATPWAPRRLERKTKKLLGEGRRFYDNDGSDSRDLPQSRSSAAEAPTKTAPATSSSTPTAGPSK